MTELVNISFFNAISSFNIITLLSNLELKSTSFPEMLIAFSNFTVAFLIASSHLLTPADDVSPLLVSKESFPALSSASTSLRSSMADSNKETPPTQVLYLTFESFLMTSRRNPREVAKSPRVRWTIPRMSDRIHSSSAVSKSTGASFVGGGGSEAIGMYWLEMDTEGVNLLRSLMCDSATSREILACVFQTGGKLARFAHLIPSYE